MFLKSAAFKKLIKEAYNGPGLKVGNDGAGIFLSGGYWVIWIKVGKIPKKELAAIIELTGEIPESGQGFSSTKAGNQYEIVESSLYRAMENARQCNTFLDVTNLSIHAPNGVMSRILQDPGSRRIFLINEKFVEMIDNTEVDYDGGETATEGALIGKYAGVFWFNNIMALHVMCREDENAKNIIDYLEQIVIGGEPGGQI
jgi:hypothetical protein